MAETTTITLPDIEQFKGNALYWANHFKVVCLLDNSHYPGDAYHSKDWILAIDAIDEMVGGKNAFEELRVFHAKNTSILFGFFGYDLKNQNEKLQSNNFDGLQFPDCYFFRPRYVLEINGDKLTVNRNYPETFELVEHIGKIHKTQDARHKKQDLTRRTSRERYLDNVKSIQQQIHAGDFYEMNYCVEFYKEHAHLHPAETFLRLDNKAKAPFSCFFKYHDRYLLCASPERFLKKEGSKLISQPVKGTVRKGDTPEENLRLQLQLRNDAKERSENVMIVDLVRNDLSKSSKEGSVKVEELYGIYEFNAVNQMISTVTSEIKDGIHFTEAIKNAFPMGSMTGAPKTEVMKNIEKYEDFKRGLYSGSVGYITPAGDFDLNVVIRSIFYNAGDKYLSIRVGSAITAESVPEREYDEVLLKAQSLVEVLNEQEQ